MRHAIRLPVLVIVVFVCLFFLRSGENIFGDESAVNSISMWNTFLGGTSHDAGNSIAIDSNGNIYITGHSCSSWGSPVRSFTSSLFADAFVVKLNSDGIMQWHTFLGGAALDVGYAIFVDNLGSVYVTGNSNESWGNPLNPKVGASDKADAFVAKLNAGNGVLQWNTFMGTSENDEGRRISVDGNGNIYVTGTSYSSWGTPLNAFNGGTKDAFLAKLNSSGVLQWNTFLGGSSGDEGRGISVDSSNNIFVTGYSSIEWGIPIRSFGGGNDAFVAKVSSSGVLQWNTFLGGADPDYGICLSLDIIGNIYIIGESASNWGIPVNPNSGGSDAFVAKLNSSGILQWNTSLGGTGMDGGWGICADNNGNISITGSSPVTWGNPLNPYYGGSSDAFVAKLNSSGILQWNTFLGGSSSDWGYGISFDNLDNLIVTGESWNTWGTPINPYAGNNEAFIAKLDYHLTVSGTVTSGGSPLTGVVMNGLPGNPTSNSSGFYTSKVDYGWAGTVTPTLSGYTFTPHSSAYTSITSDQTTDYTASLNSILTVTFPNGGEIWPLGSTRIITWSSTGVTTKIKLVLFKDGIKVGNIITNILVSSGSYKWTVGSYIGGFITAGTGYTARAITMDGALNDFSDAPFTITPLNLVSPNGYENWQLGSIHPISWTAPGMSNNVKLVLFKDGVKIGNIVTNIPAGSGSYDWPVGNYIGGTSVVGSGYTVRVIDMDGVYKDNSDAPFMITASSQLNLMSPNGGEVWSLGETQPITWAEGGYTGNVKLVLFKNGTKLGNIIVDIPANASPHYWTVGSYIGGAAEKGEGYSVRVISMDGVRRDESDGPFIIQ